MTREEFERTVWQEIDEFPPELAHRISNVAIVVEEWADDETLEWADVDSPEELFGFYHGVPLTARPASYGMVLPDKISIYRQAISRVCKTDAEIRACIRRTVRHELAHYFGLDDDRLEELGRY